MKLIITVYKTEQGHIAAYGLKEHKPKKGQVVFSVEGDNEQMEELEKRVRQKARNLNIQHVLLLD